MLIFLKYIQFFNSEKLYVYFRLVNIYIGIDLIRFLLKMILSAYRTCITSKELLIIKKKLNENVSYKDLAFISL